MGDANLIHNEDLFHLLTTRHMTSIIHSNKIHACKQSVSELRWRDLNACFPTQDHTGIMRGECLHYCKDIG